METGLFTIEGWLPSNGGLRHVSVVVDTGRISAIEDTGSPERGASEPVLLPGFIDVHCHGADGVDVNSADADGLLKIGTFLARHGITGWLPTLVPDSQSAYDRAIDSIDEAMERKTETPVAQILGVHYEGVFASEHMCGALHKEHFREFTEAERLESLPLPQSGVKMMTFAPEIEGGIELARTLTEQGWIASIGHTRASADILDQAYDAGARHLTHFYNAMTGIHHRKIGVAGWALGQKGTTFDIIADGIHVHPAMLRLAVDSKTSEGVTLISDSIAPTGLGDGEYGVWGETIEVKDGKTRNKTGNIAGSVITMGDAVRLMFSNGYSAAELAAMASSNPARLLGIGSEIGALEIGKRADFVLVDSEMSVLKTYVGGIEVS